MQQIQQRAEFISKIRRFFDQQGLLEVQTAILLKNPVTDVYIDSISADINAGINTQTKRFLHTSPELEMKKLLASGSGDIYQICAVFRDNEQGERNFNEFTLLEYYRQGFDIHQLMDDVSNLLTALGAAFKPKKISYAKAFFDYADIDILNADIKTLKKIATNYGLNPNFDAIEDLQMLLFVHCVEPQLSKLNACFIYHYPKAQAALAKVTKQVAQRFELYINGVEVANGCDELQQADEYKMRFSAEINKRKINKKERVEMDEEFLHLLQSSLPQCSGVAIGIERLLSQISL